MAINLKQISTSDSDNIKLDKVNYNFDQLVANGGGPQGPLGPKGDTGFQGVMGPQGFQGTMGFQGDVGQPGANTASYWIRKDGDNSSLTTDTLFPEALAGDLNPPVISIGFLSTDPEYNVHQALNNNQSPYQWIINRKNHFYSNLRFKSSDVLDNYFDFKINYDSSVNKTTFRMSFKESGAAIPSRIVWSADNHIFRSNVNGTSILDISTNTITFDRDAHFLSPVKINSELYIENANADLNKIATSVDINGLVTFKSIQELGGTVPYGTIISILPDVFTSTNRFINSQVIDLNQLPNTIDDALKLRVGAGIGDYEGWYLCNGKTWIGEINQSQHLVPDLNSFSYSIPENIGSINPNSQGDANIPNTDINIIGGSDISMTANVVGAPGVYSINQTVAASDVQCISNGTSTFKIKKLPQIIYLAESDLYWSDKGTGQAPTVPNTFIIDDINNSGDGCPTVSSTQTAMQGSSYTFTMTVSAQLGFYFGTTISPLAFTELTPGYNVTNIVMGSGTNPTTFTATITVSSQASTGTVRTINFNSSGEMVVVPTTTLTLQRAGDPSNTTVFPYTSTSIVYNYATGYTFDLICTADSGYYFGANPAGSIISLTGGATYTINSQTYSDPIVGGGHATLTINVTITGVASGITTLLYAVSLPIFSTAPRITAGSPIIDGYSPNPGAVTTVSNYTGGTRYIYLKIDNIYTGTGAGTQAALNAFWWTLTAIHGGSTTVPIAYSTGYVTLSHGGTQSGQFSHNSTIDINYQISLVWSYTPGGTKYPVTL
jgi:hypothetical protein